MPRRASQRFTSRSRATDVVAGIDLSDRTIIVTGANTGIGEATARTLAGAGARVVYACRQPATAQAAIAAARAQYPGCRAEFAELDLGSFASIARCAQALDCPRIDALVCNAGLATTSWATTADGFERTVGVCHIGHFLLTRLLMPRLLAAAAPRIVMVASTSHRSPASLDFERLPMTADRFNGLAAYGQAKLCNVLMAKSLQARYGARGITACALHPGTLVSTDIGRNSLLLRALMQLVSPFTKNAVQGAATSVYAVVHEPASDIAGQYLQDCRVIPCSAAANDVTVAQRLWQASERWVATAGAPAWP
jgi:WW domain-containing oxidoreductase